MNGPFCSSCDLLIHVHHKYTMLIDGFQLISAAVFILLDFKTINILTHYDIILVVIGSANNIKIMIQYKTCYSNLTHPHRYKFSNVCVYTCVRWCVRALVRVCVCMCTRACLAQH